MESETKSILTTALSNIHLLGRRLPTGHYVLGVYDYIPEATWFNDDGEAVVALLAVVMSVGTTAIGSTIRAKFTTSGANTIYCKSFTLEDELGNELPIANPEHANQAIHLYLLDHLSDIRSHIGLIAVEEVRFWEQTIQRYLDDIAQKRQRIAQMSAFTRSAL